MPTARVDLPPAVRALLDAATALVRRSSSGRVALARAADVVPADALPDVLAWLPGALTGARDETLEPLSARDVERVLRDAWHKRPDKVLHEFDPEPLAVRPAAQVHRGATAAGPVAIKVQRPGLAAAVRNDLALIDAVAVPLRQAFPALDAGALLREARESALDELDLEHEASTQRRVRRALRGVDGLHVPVPDLALSAEAVLVTELADGPTLETTAAPDPPRLARALMDAHVRAALDGFVLTDPRPGHVVLRDEGDAALLGTGVARSVERERIGAALDALAALRDDDEDAFAATVGGRLALLPEDAARRAHALIRELLGDLLTGPAMLDGPALAAIGERALARLDELLALAAELRPHPHDLHVARSLGQLVALLSRLGVREDWAALALGARA